MRLDVALVERGLCESRTEAQELISKGAVLVNGVVTTKQTRSITDQDSIEVTERRRFVSRGGEKLEGALLHVFGTKEEIVHALSGVRALDVGSSTGGFTDCLIQHGVSHVDAVDVGTEQLHPSLRNHAQVSLYENTDIRSFAPGSTYNIIVADLSFIQLEQVIGSILTFSTSGTRCFFLIKPQFEVGKGNTKKGIVKDNELVADVLASYEQLAKEKGLKEASIFPCSIRGGDGNQEYFLYGIME